MSLPSFSSPAEPLWPLREREAQTLAGWLRTSRLTLLHGEPGSGKTRLLQHGMLPLLNRRATDVAAPRSEPRQVVVPFPDRRGAATGLQRGRGEVAIFFSDWDGLPLAKLQARIDDALSLAPANRPANRLSMAGSLTALSKRFDVRFLLVFDDFDTCLTATGERAEARQFVNEMVQAMNRSGLAAHFLLVLRATSGPALERLLARLPGADPRTLVLERHRETPLPPTLRQVPASGAGSGSDDAAAAGPTPPPHTPSETLLDWQSAIDHIVSDVARAARRDAQPAPTKDMALDLSKLQAPRPTGPKPPEAASLDTANDPPGTDAAGPGVFDANWNDMFSRFRRAVSPPDVVDAPEALEAPAASAAAPAATFFLPLEADDEEPARPSSASAAAMARPAPRRTASTAALKWAAAAFVVAALAYLAWPASHEPEAPLVSLAPAPVTSPVPTPAPAPAAQVPAAVQPPAPVRPAPAAPPPLPLAAIVGTPSVGLVTDVEDGTDTRMAAELALALPSDLGFGLRRLPSAGWADTLAGLAGQPRLAIARYDALQAARRGGTAAGGLEVVAPLYIDEVYAIVRADSPLNFIHELRGRRINIGAAASSRALTGRTLYESLFGGAPPSSPETTLGEDAALQQLLAGKTLDAMITVGAQPSTWLSGLPPETARSLKLLKLDPNDAASRRALQRFLPATVHLAGWGGPQTDTPTSGGPTNTRTLGSQGTTPTLGVMAFLVAGTPADPAAEARLGTLAQALCRALPTLQRDGHPTWREVRPGLQLAVGWPYAPAASSAFRKCQAAPAPPPSAPQPSSRRVR